MALVVGRVAVAPDVHDLAAHSTRAKKPLGILQFLTRCWSRLQVSRSGRYSVERLTQFREYETRATPLRCLLICLALPAPSLLFVVLLECMPLAPPSDWRSDCGIWLRMAATTLTMGYSYVLQFHQVIPELAISQRQAVAIAACASSMYIAVLALLSYLWTFPIPFGFVVTAGPYTFFLVSATVGILGLASFRAVPSLERKAIQLTKILLVQSMLVYVYPAYTAVFFWCGEQNQPLFLVCLPVIKLAAKNLLARICVGTALEDQTPEIIVFSVELFNSLYLTACVSGASSTHLTMAVVVAIDVLQSLLNVRSLSARAERKRLRRVSRAGPSRPSDLAMIAQKIHFTSEYLVLVEYIEAFIPCVYVLYSSILAQLPNAQFYPPVPHDRRQKAATTIAGYVVFKIAMLLLLCRLLDRKLGVHALHQLAFVAETQALVLQAKLFVWVTYSLTFRLKHSGMDFEAILRILDG